MIRYQLACDAGHGFESWFRDSQAYDEQAEAGLLACPVCQSARVGKAIMAPAVLAGVCAPVAREVTSPAAETPVALLDESTQAARALLKAVREKILAEAQDVGDAFATEARRIHEGEAPARQIHGVATLAETRELLEDGIRVLPVPVVPDELN